MMVDGQIGLRSRSLVARFPASCPYRICSMSDSRVGGFAHSALKGRSCEGPRMARAGFEKRVPEPARDPGARLRALRCLCLPAKDLLRRSDLGLEFPARAPKRRRYADK